MALPKNNELLNRIVFGGIAAAIGYAAIYFGALVFLAFVFLLCFIMSYEFDKMRADGKPSFAYIAAPLLFAGRLDAAIIMVIAAMAVVQITDSIKKTSHHFLVIAIPYISIPAISLLWLRASPNGFESVLLLVAIVVATDIGGYAFGKAMGKHLLAPKISPKKTWEGLAGAITCSALAAFFISGSLLTALLGGVLAVVAQAGDLIESAIKRHYGVKDAGAIIPGHGGIMDRVDGFLLTAPLFALIHAHNSSFLGSFSKVFSNERFALSFFSKIMHFS